jgi:hypothetical protein
MTGSGEKLTVLERIAVFVGIQDLAQIQISTFTKGGQMDYYRCIHMFHVHHLSIVDITIFLMTTITEIMSEDTNLFLYQKGGLLLKNNGCFAPIYC